MKDVSRLGRDYVEVNSYLEDISDRIGVDSKKLKQVASEIQDEKLKQADSELAFPAAFAYVP